MCLAVPGKIVSIQGEELNRMAKVNFGGVLRDVSLAYVPEAQVDDYVVVHVGFALSILDQEEARQTLQDFDEIAAIAATP